MSDTQLSQESERLLAGIQLIDFDGNGVASVNGTAFHHLKRRLASLESEVARLSARVSELETKSLRCAEDTRRIDWLEESEAPLMCWNVNEGGLPDNGWTVGMDDNPPSGATARDTIDWAIKSNWKRPSKEAEDASLSPSDTPK